ncbi:hypothetical protein [Streptomyces acidiscabies]|uniref:Uncharacterized protein n=1 Tax=Streptomyces acidiscabies TaxID=42234 RepID=A0AAP6B8L1_9ACTN|nr:hypothetical protein [Streptomyces acidiscabies]MDX2960192.1 hypothetical protein [Streptomyces acidiscabies]MDX3019543.1 hypothetical protein [Streptomyces acidiscabies]MDX3793356.1 hypothetical protein [Streptomyces acidiscabies]
MSEVRWGCGASAASSWLLAQFPAPLKDGADAPVPVARAGVFATVGAALGATAHHLVAEEPPHWQRVLVGASVLFVLGLLGVRRPRSLPVVALACALAQGGLHQWLAAGHTGSAHVHHASEATATHASWTMTAAHALAALLVAALLQRADQVFWRLAQGIRHRTAALRALTGFTPASPDAQVFPPHTITLPRCAGGVALAHVVVRRGPPAARSNHTN